MSTQHKARLFRACALLGALGATSLLQCSSDTTDDGKKPGTGGDAAGGDGDTGGSKPVAGTASGGVAGKPVVGDAGAGGQPVEPGGVAGQGGSGEGGSGGAAESDYDLYVGCRDPLKGTIQHYRVGSESGTVAKVDEVLATAEVSNTAWNAAQDVLYVAHTDTGRITTFTRNKATGTLTLQAFVTVAGAPIATDNPATQTLEVDATGKFLLAANYTANTVLVFKLKADGSVGAQVDSLTDGLNAHQTLLNSTNKFALVPYFGSNFIGVYAFNEGSGKLTAHVPLKTNIPAANSGPRHLAMHKNSKWLYAITETAGSIALFDWDNVAGTLAHVETVSSVAATFPAATKKDGSEIEIDAAGKFLYVSNRTDGVINGNIGAFSINATTGKLTPVDFYDTHGLTPRHFSLSPKGELLVVGNQASDNMSVFTVNQTTGALTYVKTTTTCKVPFFARMAEHG